jgi:hypothetical protein
MQLRPYLFAALAAAIAAPVLAQDAPLDTRPPRARLEWMAAAAAEGRTGTARKTAPVDARPAVPGEVIVTRIAGQGIETQSPPAVEGDWVVRNRCEDSGDEEILVTAERFPTRYGEAQSEPDAAGYREFHPTGAEMVYAIVPESDGEFAILAPWGELQRVMPGDTMAQVADKPDDTYRIDRRAFECTYEIVTPAGG